MKKLLALALLTACNNSPPTPNTSAPASVVPAANPVTPAAATMAAPTPVVAAASAVTPANEASEAIVIDAAKLVSEYKANEVKADAAYKDKRVRATGVVDSIGKDVLGNAFVTLGAKSEFLKVQCSFEDESALASLANLTKGDKATVEGDVSGKLLHVQLKECALIPAAAAAK